ncbi:hypothetical protein ACI7RC_24700 [Brevibacillus sp. B_LB10_24]|uniref:hypothetical protein n=1 Tax=Brevibacillus sp. B_LB10_24 TaxID=3380645 RepID=UPI0038BDB8B3
MSERSGKLLLGTALLFLGVVILLGHLGFVKGLLGFLISGAVIFWGGSKLLAAKSTGGRIWGAFLVFFGILMLTGKVHLLFSTLIAVGILYLGYRLIRSHPEPSAEEVSYYERKWARSVLKEDTLDSWEDDLRSRRP